MSETQVEYRVTGMSCGGCARSVRSALARALPAVDVTVDHEQDKVRVVGAHDEAVFRAAIVAAGFGVEGTAKSVSS